jgi:hypothetical protein
MSRQPDLSVCVTRRPADVTNKSEPRGMTESDLAVRFSHFSYVCCSNMADTRQQGLSVG